MPTFTLQPTVTTSPDQGGTLAVTGAANTGHASTNAAASATGLAPNGNQVVTQAKSCRWSSFQAPPLGHVTSLRLKFTWAAQGSKTETPASDGSAVASVLYVVEYSLNGGGSWIGVVSQGAPPFNTGASENIALSAGQSISQVQVRDRFDTSANATGGTVDNSTASANLDASVSSIQLEAVVSPPPSPVMIT